VILCFILFVQEIQRWDGLQVILAFWYIHAVLYANSLLQDPQPMVCTAVMSLGATLSRISSTLFTQSFGGIIPRAGRFTNAVYNIAEYTRDSGMAQVGQ